MSDETPRRRWIGETFGEVMLWDGCDDALIGVGHRCGKDPVAVYHRDRLVDIFANGMSLQEADEWVSVNIEGAWHGERTPMVIVSIPPDHLLDALYKDDAEAESEEVTRLRSALEQIAANKDEPYSSEFAKDILDRRATP